MICSMKGIIGLSRLSQGDGRCSDDVAGMGGVEDLQGVAGDIGSRGKGRRV